MGMCPGWSNDPLLHAHQRREKSYWDVTKWWPLRCEYHVSDHLGTITSPDHHHDPWHVFFHAKELLQYLMWRIWEPIGKINKRSPKCTWEGRGYNFVIFPHGILTNKSLLAFCCIQNKQDQQTLNNKRFKEASREFFTNILWLTSFPREIRKSE